MKGRKKLRLQLECFYVHMWVCYTELLCVGPVCGSVRVGISSSPDYPGCNEEPLEKEKVADSLFATSSPFFWKLQKNSSLESSEYFFWMTYFPYINIKGSNLRCGSDKCE